MPDHHQRESVFDRVRAALAPQSPRRATPPPPDWESSLCISPRYLASDDLWENFAANFAAAHGFPLTSTAQLAELLRRPPMANTGFCDPKLEGPVGAALRAAGFELSDSFERASPDRYAFAITRAAGAIAETGSLILDDFQTADRLAALAPWTHVATVRRSDIVRTVPEAIARLGTSPNTVWVTGPSKTADVEGILIEGVHGPGVQACLLIDG